MIMIALQLPMRSIMYVALFIYFCNEILITWNIDFVHPSLWFYIWSSIVKSKHDIFYDFQVYTGVISSFRGLSFRTRYIVFCFSINVSMIGCSCVISHSNVFLFHEFSYCGDWSSENLPSWHFWHRFIVFGNKGLKAWSIKKL